MKKFKILLGVFVLSIFASVTGANAATHLSFVTITLPAWSGTYVSKVEQKDIVNYQYMKSDLAKDNFSGDSRAVSARTYDTDGIYSNWIAAYLESGYVTWGENTNMFTGNYKVNLKATKATASTVRYNGTWFLDQRLVELMQG